jgi:hypothetical protein
MQRFWGKTCSDPFGMVLKVAVLFLLCLPVKDFLTVAFGRMWYPYEVEWLEGEIAMYAIRFMENPSLAHLYPAYENGLYCPHLYPPVYQMILSLFFKVFGVHLGWGRLISVLATFGILGAIFTTVYNHSKQVFPALVGALSYLMFFKATGYWFDLVRVDSLAYCFAVWAACFILWPNGKWRILLTGLVLAYLALFTKQTSVFIPIAALMVRGTFSLASKLAPSSDSLFPPLHQGQRFLWHPKQTFWASIPFITIIGTITFLLLHGPLKDMAFYLLEVPSQHNIYWKNIQSQGVQNLWQYYNMIVWMIPLGLWLPLITKPWPWPRWKVALWALPLATIVTVAVACWIDKGKSLPDPANRAWGTINQPGIFSVVSFRFVMSSWTTPIIWSFALCCAALAIWPVRWISCKTPLRGITWIIMLFGAQHIAAVTWVKIGGYINNFTPLFVVQSIAFGVVMAWAYSSIKWRFFNSLLTIALYFSLAFSWYGTRIPFYTNPRAEARLKQERALAIKDGLFDPKLNTPFRLNSYQFKQATGDYRLHVLDLNDEKILDEWMPWVTDGLRYHYPQTAWFPLDQSYGNQLYSDSWPEEWTKVEEALKKLAEEGPVYLPHQNYLGYLCGIEPGPSADSIRDVHYLKKKSPDDLLKKVRNGEWLYIVLMEDIQYDWLPSDVKREIQKTYIKQGQLLDGSNHKPDLLPRTGCTVRPRWVYKRKPPLISKPGESPIPDPPKPNRYRRVR